ncbi:hypothetical protein [Aeromicrobium massiliense]|uniref:hypothetical protein n=1 Tax=Aeromicrobium massiliense TaxID=1464554 RepID=UPI00030C3351|nr:hypothetical protein [Aeromicrobium massiliense]
MIDDATSPDPTPADQGPAEPPARRGVRKPLAIGLAVAAIGAIAAGGVYAASRLTGSDASAMAALVPSDALGFAAVNLDPSASQKLALDDLLKRLEREGGEAGVVDADVLSVDTLLEELTCDDVSLADGDWAGDRAAIVALPTKGKDEPVTVAVYASVDDERAAKELADKLGKDGTDCGDDTTVAATYLDQDGGWLVATDGALPALPGTDGFESLADADDFRDDVDALGDEGVATAWADMEAAASAAEDLGVDATGADGRIAATVRASDESLELFATMPVADDAPEPEASVADVLGKLPADAVGVLASPGGTPAAADLAEAEKAGMVSFVKLLSEPLGVAVDGDGTFTGAVKAAEKDVRAGVTEVSSLVSLFTSGFAMGPSMDTDSSIVMEGEHSGPELDAEFERCLETATSVDDFEKCTPPQSAYATDDMIAEDLGDLTAPEAFEPETADAGDGFVRFAMPGGSTDVDEPLTGSRLLEHVEGDLDDLTMLGVVDVRALLGEDADDAGELGAIDHALLTGERDGDREQLRLRVVLR